MSLQQFLKKLPFPGLHPDQHGVCLVLMKQEAAALLFEFDDQLVPNTILLSCEICPIPPENRESVLLEALKRNHHIEETLACKPDADVLTLHRRIHPDIDAAELKEIVDSFLECVVHWKEAMLLIKPEPTESLGFEPPSFKA